MGVLGLLTALLLTQAGSRTDAIVGGEADEATRAVFQIFTALDDGGVTACSGVLISPRLLLSAAHCFEDPDGGLRAPYLATGSARTQGAQFVTTIGVAPDPDRARLGPQHGAHDLAIVILREAVTGVTPLERVNVPRPDWASVGGRSVGYGVTANGRDDADLRRSVATPLTAIQLLTVTAGSRTKGTCFGDSGGPLLLKGRDGKERVLGIASAVFDRDCGEGLFARPSGDWIRSMVAGLEPAELAPSCGADARCRFACDPAAGFCPAANCAPADPDCTRTGRTCESNESCAEGVCRAAAGGQGVCSKTCASPADCPGRVACTAGVCELEAAQCGCGSAAGLGGLWVVAWLLRRRFFRSKCRAGRS